MKTLNSDKMRDMKMGRLILSMSLPAMLSMLVKSLYNIVDSVYVSYYSESALDALSIVFPLQTIVIALAIAIGVGTNAMVARKLGEGRRDEANKLVGNGLFLAVCGTILCIILAFFLPSIFMSWFTDVPSIIQDGKVYLFIIMAFGFGVFIEICLTRVLQATGNMRVPMISQMMGAIINIILDPVFIFGFWFVPAMGVKGAAIATVIGQIASMIYVVLVFVFKKQDVDIKLQNCKPDIHYISQIARVGLPTFVMNAITSFTLSIMNLIVKPYPYAITVHGVFFKLRSFIFMPVFGLTQGLMPILSYNYGANNFKRFKEARKIGYITAAVILGCGTALFLLAPSLLLSLFKMSGELKQAGIYVIRVISLSFIGSAFCIVSSTIFQSLGKGVYSLLTTLSRELIFSIPFALILSKLFGFDGVFFYYLLAECLVAVIVVPIQFKVSRSLFKKRDMELFPKLEEDI